MKNIEIKVDRNTSYVDLPNNILGINGENLQGDIIMSFKNGFVDGIAWLEIEMPDKTKGYIMMDKVGEKYTLKIKSSLLTQVGLIHMNLRITEDENIDGIPVFKSNIFYLKVVESINATETIPDEYETWMDILNTKIVEVDNLNIELEKEYKKSTITITNKDGSAKSVEVLDGQDGDDYILTQEDKNEIVDTVKPLVEESIQPTLDNNLQLAKDYADSIKPTKTSELTNDSNFSTTNQNNNFSAPQTINGTLTINGDIVQNGEQYETHAEQVYTKNDEIITRDGAVGGLSEGQLTGIKAKKYDGANDGQLGFDANGEARVGDEGDTQPLLTRDELANLQDGQVLVWNGTNLKAVGSSSYIKNTDVATISKAGIAKMWTSTNDDGEIGLNISTEV